MTDFNLTNLGAGLFAAKECPGVLEGFCVHMDDTSIVYAGPLRGCPPVDGKIVFLNPVDFASLKAKVKSTLN